MSDIEDNFREMGKNFMYFSSPALLSVLLPPVSYLSLEEYLLGLRVSLRAALWWGTPW